MALKIARGHNRSSSLDLYFFVILWLRKRSPVTVTEQDLGFWVCVYVDINTLFLGCVGTYVVRPPSVVIKVV